MPATLRVLIAEDRPADAELMVYELSRSGFEPKWTRVETEEEYLKGLQDAPDVILADHTLPEFDAPRALQLLKKTDLDTPLIVVTGSISEEVAVERIKQGASDYILKDRMARLGPAVQRALEEKKLRDEKRKAEELIHRNLERIRALHEINVAITSTLDLRTMLNVLLEKIDLFLPFPSVTTVRLLNRQTGILEFLACRNLDEEEWRAQAAQSTSGRAKAVVDTKAPLIVGNVQTDPRTHNPGIYRKYGLVSYAGVPLIAKGEVLGVLGVYTKEEHEFTNEETEFLMTLADQAAIAIHNAQLYDETVRSNKVKDEFLSVVSHELRTPLSAVMGYAGLIKDGMLGEINPEQEKALGKLLSRARDQLSMVNSILYVSSLESQAVKLESHEFDLSKFLEHLRSVYGFPLGKEVTLNWNYPLNLPVMKTDSGKLTVILQNLIDNGIKFTHEGDVTFSVRLVERMTREVANNRQARSVEFKVTDTGIGMAKENLSRIFDKFYQIDSSRTRAYEGAGVGLYIVKRFTEMLGGTVEVESEPGNGSTFTIVIPYEVAS